MATSLANLMLTDWNAYKKAIKEQQRLDKLINAGKPQKTVKAVKHKFEDEQAKKEKANKRVKPQYEKVYRWVNGILTAVYRPTKVQAGYIPNMRQLR